MGDFVPWSSQPLEEWASKYAAGKFIDLGGRKTHYIEKGRGEPVILLHGFFYDSYLWQSNIDALAENFRVLALDLWGSGYSTREPLDYGYPLYTEQVRLFMDNLGIASASLAGQSLGGGIALHFCAHHRERVNKLLLVSPAGMPNHMPLSGRIATLPAVGELIFGIKSNAVRKNFIKNFWIHDPALITDSYFENATRFHKVRGTIECLLGVFRRNFFDKLGDEMQLLAEAEVPNLIVWGRDDRAIPLSCGVLMHSILKGSRLEVIDNAGHLANFEQAQAFNSLSVSFLSD